MDVQPPVPRTIRGGGLGSGLPGLPAELKRRFQLEVAEPKGAGHRTQLQYSGWNPAGLGREPCGGPHSGHAGHFLWRVTSLSTAPLDKQAEPPNSYLPVELREAFLIDNHCTHYS